MDVTLGSIFGWTGIFGAEYQTRVLSATNAPLVAPTDNGTVNSISVGVLLAGQVAGTYKLQVRAMAPGGALMSPWASLAVSLVSYVTPTGLIIT